jgi:tRNA 5-methylaminomethyl-2-thiouridine biosynthesis bifunctional protein
MSDDGPLDWTPDGQPRSRRFGDVYFSREDGLAETRAVFLQGCGLPDAWAGRRRFVVGELGFGTGLNIAALLDLWERTRPPGGRLHVFSVEADPVGPADAARALSRWPELASVVGPLLARWPGRARGVHRVELPEFCAILDVAVMDAAEALAGWSGVADAWFLDGFSPALNPQMWSDALMRSVAARSAPGARAATFTVAGQVRRGLAAAGFAVAKRPGFGRKRERLEAVLAGAPQADAAWPQVAVVGGGIAGASIVRALGALGAEPVLFEAERSGAGASGNPAALVTPRLDAGLGPAAELAARAFARAVDLYAQHPDAVIARGVLQLEATPRDAQRFARIAGSDLFEPGALVPLAAAAASARLGEPASGALDQTTALVIEPAVVLRAWSGPLRRARVAALRREGPSWTLLGPEGQPLAQADAVVIAAGQASAALAPGLPLQAVRGQASWTAAPETPVAAAWGGYAIPTRDGVLFGATHDRDDPSSEVRAQDHDRNRATLAGRLPGLAARLAARELTGRAAPRAATPDRTPLAGALQAGLFVLTGLGGRGFSLAPLLAEHVAALVAGAPSPLSTRLADLVDPTRFAPERKAPT